MAEKEQRAFGEKKSAKKFIIMIIAVVAIVLGGGGAAYFFMSGHSGDVENAEPTPKKPEEESKSTDMLYYDISKPLIVDFPRGSSVHLIQISLSFLVEGQATLEALKKHDPMIRNNLLMLISAEDVDSLNTREGKERLRADILNEVVSVLAKMTGKSHVKEVFFTAFVMQ